MQATESQALAGQVAVITGAGRGIGQAIACAYARAGAAVICAARSGQQLADTVQKIEAGGGRALAIEADVTRYEQVKGLFDEAVRVFGGVDLVLANAGTGSAGRKIEAVDPERWAQTIQVNLIGAFNTAHAAIPHLRARGGGKLIFMGSGTRHGAAPGMSDYAGSKLAVWKLVQILAMELQDASISVNELIPGPVRTAMTAPGGFRFPAGEWVKDPEDVVPLAMFLASQANDGPSAQSFSLMRRAG
jgi:3-oxoacyl-[acyl-carrier protein] reductase